MRRIGEILAMALLAVIITICPVMAQQQGFLASGTGTHTTVTATAAARPQYQNVAISISASCATTPAAPVALTLKDGSTVIGTWYITTVQTIPFPAGAPGTAGNAMTANLADCGSSVAGSVTLNYLQR